MRFNGAVTHSRPVVKLPQAGGNYWLACFMAVSCFVLEMFEFFSFFFLLKAVLKVTIWEGQGGGAGGLGPHEKCAQSKLILGSTVCQDVYNRHSPEEFNRVGRASPAEALKQQQQKKQVQAQAHGSQQRKQANMAVPGIPRP